MCFRVSTSDRNFISDGNFGTGTMKLIITYSSPFALEDRTSQARTQNFEKGGYEGKTQMKPRPLLMTTFIVM